MLEFFINKHFKKKEESVHRNCLKEDYKTANKYRIAIPHFWCLEYYEGDKKMTVDIDFRDVKLYLSTKLITCWDVPFEKEVITYEDKKRIIRNIADELIKINEPGRVILEELNCE